MKEDNQDFLLYLAICYTKQKENYYQMCWWHNTTMAWYFLLEKTKEIFYKEKYSESLFKHLFLFYFEFLLKSTFFLSLLKKKNWKFHFLPDKMTNWNECLWKKVKLKRNHSNSNCYRSRQQLLIIEKNKENNLKRKSFI